MLTVISLCPEVLKQLFRSPSPMTLASTPLFMVISITIRAVVGVMFTLIVFLKKAFTSRENLMNFPLGGKKKGSMLKQNMLGDLLL